MEQQTRRAVSLRMAKAMSVPFRTRLPFVAVLRPSEMFKLVFQLGMFPEETLLYIDKRTFYLVSFFGLKTSSEKQRILKGDIKEELKKLLSNQNLSKIRCGVV